MPVRNEFQRVTDRMFEELEALRKKADKANPVPFGEERLSPRDARRRLEQLTPQQRQALIQQKGSGWMVKVLGGKPHDNA